MRTLLRLCGGGPFRSYARWRQRFPLLLAWEEQFKIYARQCLILFAARGETFDSARATLISPPRSRAISNPDAAEEPPALARQRFRSLARRASDPVAPALPIPSPACGGGLGRGPLGGGLSQRLFDRRICDRAATLLMNTQAARRPPTRDSRVTNHLLTWGTCSRKSASNGHRYPTEGAQKMLFYILLFFMTCAFGWWARGKSV